jgi:hypothetical protein
VGESIEGDFRYLGRVENNLAPRVVARVPALLRGLAYRSKGLRRTVCEPGTFENTNHNGRILLRLISDARRRRQRFARRRCRSSSNSRVGSAEEFAAGRAAACHRNGGDLFWALSECASVAVNNATKLNYLASASRGSKQLSALGEQYVMALPDREKAKAVLARARQHRRGRKSTRGADVAPEQES